MKQEISVTAKKSAETLYGGRVDETQTEIDKKLEALADVLFDKWVESTKESYNK